MPNSRAACRWLIPSTWQARRTRAYKSTIFIPQAFRSPLRRKARQRANFAPPQPDYPAASVRDFLSAALTMKGRLQILSSFPYLQLQKKVSLIGAYFGLEVAILYCSCPTVLASTGLKQNLSSYATQYG